MKICPQCRTSYTDDTLQYCLQDGNPLNNYTPSETPVANWSETETLVSPRSPANYETSKTPTQSWQGNQPPNNQPAETPVPKSNALKIVLLTLLGMVVLFAVGGVAAFVIWRNSRSNVIANNNTRPVNVKTPTPNVNTNQNANTNANVNSNVNTNVNANVNTNVNAVAPTVQPTLDAEEAAQTKEDVANVIDDWKSSYESLDLEYAMSYYADTVDYYNSGKVGIGRVRADKQRAFDAYDNISFNISNLSVTPDATGTKATAVFDKEWRFENSEKTNSGKVQQQMQFVKNNGKWKITGERDLKVYYLNK